MKRHRRRHRLLGLSIVLSIAAVSGAIWAYQAVRWRPVVRISFDLRKHDPRVHHQTASALARDIAISLPDVDHIVTRCTAERADVYVTCRFATDAGSLMAAANSAFDYGYLRLYRRKLGRADVSELPADEPIPTPGLIDGQPVSAYYGPDDVIATFPGPGANSPGVTAVALGTLAAVAAASVGIFASAHAWRRHRRAYSRANLCPVCGYDLSGSQARCSECGTLRRGRMHLIG